MENIQLNSRQIQNNNKRIQRMLYDSAGASRKPNRQISKTSLDLVERGSATMDTPY